MLRSLHLVWNARRCARTSSSWVAYGYRTRGARLRFPLPAALENRRWWHGRGLASGGYPASAQGGGEASSQARGARSSGCCAAAARSAGRSYRRPPGSSDGLRGGRLVGGAVPGHATGGGRDAFRTAHPGAVAGGRGNDAGGARRGCVGRGARARDRPSRPEALQHHPGPARSESRRLRSGEPERGGGADQPGLRHRNPVDDEP